MDFGTGVSTLDMTTPYTEDGYVMSAVNGAYAFRVSGTDRFVFLNYVALPRTMRFQRIDGAAFDFVSVDYGIRGSPDVGTLRSSSGQELTLDTAGTITPTGPEWKNVSWVEIERPAHTRFASLFDFDNVTFVDPGPVPVRQTTWGSIKALFR